MLNTVKVARREVGMSVSELARRANTSRQTIYAVEDQKRKDISGELMLNISTALRKPVESLFFTETVTQELQRTL